METLFSAVQRRPDLTGDLAFPFSVPIFDGPTRVKGASWVPIFSHALKKVIACYLWLPFPFSVPILSGLKRVYLSFLGPIQVQSGARRIS